MARQAPGRSTQQDVGSQALSAFGTRLAALFLATAVAGLLLMGGGDIGRSWSLGTALTAWSGDPRSYEVIGWVVAGVAGGLGVARGPAWGLAAYAVAALLMIVPGLAPGSGAPLIAFLGPLTYCLGGVAINVAARRGFAGAQEALVAAETAEAAHRVAVERWRARRAADRELHDTVLATLTLLSHGGVGVSDALLRERCARDVAALEAPEGAGSPSAGPAPDPAPAPAPDFGWLHELVARSEEDGLTLALHLQQEPALADSVVAALRDALAQCFENVRRHAGTREIEVTCSRAGAQLVVVVLDRGVGFDPASVPPDRFGLRSVVRDRIQEEGGTVSIWSAPWQGTSIVLRVPVLDHVR